MMQAVEVSLQSCTSEIKNWSILNQKTLLTQQYESTDCEIIGLDQQQIFSFVFVAIFFLLLMQKEKKYFV